MKRKILLIIFIMIMLVIPSYKVEAKTLQDLKNELSSLEKKYEENKNKKDLTDAEITKISKEINTIVTNINSIKNDIKTSEEEIVKSNEEIQNKSNETDELLKFLQISSGENVYLEYLFQAESYTDFIYRYSIVSQLTEYNTNLMNELKVLIDNLEKKKAELSNKKTKLENQNKELSSKINTLRIASTKYHEEGTSIEEDIKDLKKSIKNYEDRGCKNNENISTCGNGSIGNAAGWSYPLAWGCVTSEYTGWNERSDWSGGGGHHAIDLDCVGEGTKVYAAASGKVARVRYHGARVACSNYRERDCGGNMVYIYHNVNGQPYTTVYMHLLSINVSEGQYVDENTVIGYVGGTSTSYQNGGYDCCTTGAHLHFGIAYDFNAYNFNGYSFNPRNVYGFPALIYSGGTYFSR
mgnify:FL=1